MKAPPFLYGSPVINKSFIDRKKEVERLRSNLKAGKNSAVIAPAGWGKTSLVRHAMAGFYDEGFVNIPLEMDLFSVMHADEFLKLFARSVIMASSDKWNDWVQIAQEYFSKTKPKINLGLKPDSDFTLEFDRESLLKFPDEIMNLPGKLAADKDLHFTIVFDAFHRCEKMNGIQDLLMAMKSCMTKSSRVTFILIGNNTPWMMEQLGSPKGVLSDLVDVMRLDRIEAKYWIKYIQKGFTKSGKTIEEKTVHSMVKKLNSHPYYMQQLARFIWLNCEKKTGKKELNNGFKELMAANQPVFRKTVETLSPTQVTLLGAIAAREKHLTGAGVMEKYRLGTPRNVAKNREMLLRKGIIQPGEALYEFSDPLFEIWFRNEYQLQN
jgi:hypothetical protein